MLALGYKPAVVITGTKSSRHALLGMFEDLELINKWRLSRRTLAHFILMVCRGYRNPPYHNWTHAFSVTHFIYICGKNLPLTGNFLKDIEFLALFVASLCHDIDHRGTNNAFQTERKAIYNTVKYKAHQQTK
ncbi:hypothetical protein X801_02974 [Opisthorchis viverrini]|uniref:PDEase domain-containing protein n=1 Tax=Opisthorchis viverrini TaxID=6198 RepID=A0A1S8X346_OPIVI|nr:hypothetical protein X801_02974 [Opisthorchis viverrini]